MLRYYKSSIILTIIGIICAYLWGEYRTPGAGLLSVFIVAVLSILEVSLSFDNAVVNAMRLEKMTPEWQHRFLTWGIVIAVFGMRLVFPVIIVSVFANISILETMYITINDVDKYKHYLELSHIAVLTFGGSFLLMLFLHYFFNEKKVIHWLKPIEEKLSHVGHISGIETVATLLGISILQSFVPEAERMHAILAGLAGVILYIVIHGLSEFMEEKANHTEALTCPKQSFKAGFIAFMYLELIDASFSLDGVLGAFALSKDVIIITIGLAIGAMFVRSFTIMMVEKKTLKQFLYLEHGAHWAIGALAVIMLIATVKPVPEAITGLIGLVFIVAAYISSIKHNDKKSV
ncbi:MAG: DUF475 domain-containing protein [Candidatus Gastranaerophilales bacterium]|nr:DUF475 domain-containing protein [Candidatus Gastranaerophilales bacterium]